MAVPLSVNMLKCSQMFYVCLVLCYFHSTGTFILPVLGQIFGNIMCMPFI